MKKEITGWQDSQDEEISYSSSWLSCHPVIFLVISSREKLG
jgi:hypothetical protein